MTEKAQNKERVLKIFLTLMAVIAMLLACGVLVLKIIAKFSYEDNTNIEFVLFMIEYNSLLNRVTYGGLSLVLLLIFFELREDITKGVGTLFVLALILVIIVIVGNFVIDLNKAYGGGARIELLKASERKVLQDIVFQNNLPIGYIDDAPDELRICFDKEFKGEICKILFDRLLTKKKNKDKEKEALQSLEERKAEALTENYNRLKQTN
ncbi:hypothetical protein [Helicobacter magdeburgensis]|uniref:hypothetical protein n=1 Tax=Helicobacter magdeburgensis TaxID=471858 RepID=UPI00051F9E1A|nr:hypothetical protein [Helicobacter magdeburgensis]